MGLLGGNLKVFSKKKLFFVKFFLEAFLMQKFKSVEELVNQLKPEKPVYCIRKNSIKSSVQFFLNNFPGKVLYAVKTNPHPYVIKEIIDSGIDQFDVASIEEIKSIKKYNIDAKCSYMHTVKSRESIKEAYFNYNIKTFSLDTKDELIKIIESTGHAKDLELFVRVSVSNEHAEIDLSKKFGALNSEATGLLRLAKQYSKKIGLSFHVGSQCMHPISYSKGINEIANIIKKTKIVPDYINVGGGFPTIYPDLIPQSLDNYFKEIKDSLENLKLKKLPEVICEPGRALVAESGSTIVKVNLRKKQKLYINEGTYGTLFDAGTPNIVFPSKMIKETSNKIISKKLTAFDFFGPTCDSMDYMKGPFVLPNNIKENDYIELGQLGAYGLTFRTQFNGYYSNEIYEVEDKPIMTMYDKDINKANLVA
jgi:ornithine decarboxylase